MIIIMIFDRSLVNSFIVLSLLVYIQLLLLLLLLEGNYYDINFICSLLHHVMTSVELHGGTTLVSRFSLSSQSVHFKYEKRSVNRFMVSILQRVSFRQVRSLITCPTLLLHPCFRRVVVVVKVSERILLEPLCRFISIRYKQNSISELMIVFC